MPKYRMFAAIELGSADIIMKIAQISKRSGIEIINSLRYNISLGAEVYRCGIISYSCVEEICGCLEKCMRAIKEYGVEDYVCYATTAVREAENNDYFIDQIGIRCGLKVNIISNSEEIFLHNKALALKSSYFDSIIEGGAVIVDVNTGNTQVSYYYKSKLKLSQNLPIGSLRVLEILSRVSGAPVGFSGLLEDYIRMNIDNYKDIFFKVEDFSYIVLTGLQASFIRRISGAQSEIITNEQMDKVYEHLKNSGIQDICEDYGISYEDAELLFPTVLIYKMFVNEYRKKTVIVPGISTAEGMCVEFAENNGYTHTNHIFTNDIISSAQSCASRFGVNPVSYKKEIEYCEVIFNALARKFGLSKRDMLLLKLAAIFTDTGKYININGYTKHSAGIVNSNPIPGLSQKELKSVEYIVMFADGKAENEEYKYFPKSRKLIISKLAAILMSARSLNISHKNKIKSIKVSVRDGILKIIAFSKEDITVEKLEFERVRPFFEEVFGIKAEIAGRKE